MPDTPLKRELDPLLDRLVEAVTELRSVENDPYKAPEIRAQYVVAVGDALNELGAVMVRDAKKSVDRFKAERDSEIERANALAHVLQPLLAADLEDLARELRWTDCSIADEAAQLLEDTITQAKRYGVIKEDDDGN